MSALSLTLLEICRPSWGTIFRFGSGKSHALTREAVLEKLKDKDFIALQLKQIRRAK